VILRGDEGEGESLILGNLLSYASRTEVWIAAAGLVAFLVLAWVLRGAPLGQALEQEEDVEAPRASYRDRTVVGVVVGLLLILSGALVALYRGIPWSVPLFGLGFGLVLSLVSINHRYRHASPSLRRTIELSSVLLNASLLAGILIVINVIAFRYGGQPLDLTRERTYSLSSLSLNQLRSLEQPVTFTVIAGTGPVAAKQRARVSQLLESYKALNPAMIHVVSLDPYYDLARVDSLKGRVPELELLHGGGVLLEYGQAEAAQYVVVRNQDMFERVPGEAVRPGSARFASAFTGEDEITSALIRLREGKKSKVAFTAKHGEPATSDLNPGGRGVGNWKTRLVKTGSDVIDLDLIQGDVPDDLTLLLIVGPKTPFKPQELDRLKGYADRGGPVLVMLDNAEAAGLGDFLKSFNLEIGRGRVVDLKNNWRHNPALVLAPLGAGARHPISDPLGGNRVVFLPGAAPIRVLGMAASKKGQAPETVNRSLLPTPFLKTGTSSWTETDPENPKLQFDASVDAAGPVTVGVAVSQRLDAAARAPGAADLKPRLVLFSSPGLAENIAQEIDSTNLDLLMNAAAWLRGRTETMGIVPKTHVALTLTVDPVLRSRLILVPTVTAVLLIIAVGITIYVARRE
jgi:ABC-type uncharacterized transport system